MATFASLTAAAMQSLLDHHGMITTSQLRSNGVARRARDRLVAAGILEHAYKSVYRITSAPLTLQARCVALSLAHPSGFVTGPTGGKIRGLRRMPATADIHFSIPHTLGLAPIEGVALRRSSRVERGDVQRRADGINIASPWRLAFDLASDLDEMDHASVIEQILHDRHCGVGALIVVGRRLAHPTRPGSRRYLSTMASRVPGGALESHPEVVVAKMLQERGVPVVAQTTWLQLPNGKQARIDISAPDVCWGVEVDAHPDHLLLQGTTADKRRDRQAHLIGWQIERVTTLDMLDMDAMIDELVALYTLRCTEFAAIRSLTG